MSEEQMPQIIVPENSRIFKICIIVEYPAVNYDTEVLSVYPQKEPEESKQVSFNRVPNVSRSMIKPLPKHNPSKNLVKVSKKRHIIDNKKMESDTEFDSDSESDSKYSYENNNQSEMMRYIKKLEKQNKRLRKLLNKYNSQSSSMKTNVFDLMLYIISGIFIIFVLDSFIRLIRNKA